MCLVSESNLPCYADSDIYVYKIGIPEGNSIRTPYRDFLFPVGQTLHDSVEECFKPFETFTIIESGYFHSYSDLGMAKCSSEVLNKKLGNKCKVYQAVIPKGSKYYTGQFQDVCSKDLIIIKECFD